MSLLIIWWNVAVEQLHDRHAGPRVGHAIVDIDISRHQPMVVPTVSVYGAILGRRSPGTYSRIFPSTFLHFLQSQSSWPPFDCILALSRSCSSHSALLDGPRHRTRSESRQLLRWGDSGKVIASQLVCCWNLDFHVPSVLVTWYYCSPNRLIIIALRVLRWKRGRGGEPRNGSARGDKRCISPRSRWRWCNRGPRYRWNAIKHVVSNALSCRPWQWLCTNSARRGRSLDAVIGWKVMENNERFE